LEELMGVRIALRKRVSRTRQYAKSIPVEERGSSRQSQQKTDDTSTQRKMILIPHVFFMKNFLDELEDKRFGLSRCKFHCVLSVDEKDNTILRIALSKGASHLLPGRYASVKKSLTLWELVEAGYSVEDLDSHEIVEASLQM
jgi:hypothetical protein